MSLGPFYNPNNTIIISLTAVQRRKLKNETSESAILSVMSGVVLPFQESPLEMPWGCWGDMRSLAHVAAPCQQQDPVRPWPSGPSSHRFSPQHPGQLPRQAECRASQVGEALARNTAPGAQQGPCSVPQPWAPLLAPCLHSLQPVL